MYQLDKVSDRAHDDEANADGLGDLEEFALVGWNGHMSASVK